MNRISDLFGEDFNYQHDASWLIDYDEDFGVLLCTSKCSDGTPQIIFEQGDLSADEFIKRVFSERFDHFNTYNTGDVVVSSGARLMQAMDLGTMRAKCTMFRIWEKEFSLN